MAKVRVRRVSLAEAAIVWERFQGSGFSLAAFGRREALPYERLRSYQRLRRSDACSSVVEAAVGKVARRQSRRCSRSGAGFVEVLPPTAFPVSGERSGGTGENLFSDIRSSVQVRCGIFKVEISPGISLTEIFRALSAAAVRGVTVV